MNNKNRTQGFTLIELLIVIAIIGILAAVLIPNLLGAQKRAYDTGSASCAKSIQTTLAIAQIDSQTYPTTITKAIPSGAGSACNPATLTVAGTGGQNDYTFTVVDTRGAKIYTATPSSLTSANQ